MRSYLCWLTGWSNATGPSPPPSPSLDSHPSPPPHWTLTLTSSLPLTGLSPLTSSLPFTGLSPLASPSLDSHSSPPPHWTLTPRLPLTGLSPLASPSLDSHPSPSPSLQELMAGVEEVAASRYGRRVLLYLLAPRASRHFSPQFIQLLSLGDNNAHSKKPADVRRRELLEAVAPAMLSLATSRVLDWVQSKTHSLLLLEVMLSLPGDLCTLYQPLLEALCGENGVSLMENGHTHWVLTRLITSDKSCAEGQGTPLASIH